MQTSIKGYFLLEPVILTAREKKKKTKNRRRQLGPNLIEVVA